jgi:hypothetical protein
MVLGSNVTRFFTACIYWGAVSIFCLIFTLAFDGSPYRYGRLGGAWFLVQISSSVALLYSGMFGIMTCNVTEIDAIRFNMKVAWGVWPVLAVLLLGSLGLAWYDFQKHSTSTWVDWLAVGIGIVTVGMAVFAYIQACRYFLRLHRLRRPYEDLIG